jgi:hypothetical protein
MGRLMKMALKCKNDEFFVMPLKHVLSVMDLINHSRTPKLWAIAHENGPKTMNFWSYLSNMYMDLVNHYETSKLWAIGHENGPKMQKNYDFWSCLSNMY